MDGGGQTSLANQRQLSLRVPNRSRREPTSALTRSRGQARLWTFALPVPLGALFFLLLANVGPLAGEPPLVVERRIALPDTSGRIDHLAADLDRRRLLVAELGNRSLDVVDLAANRPVRRITGLAEPQGVGYSAKADVVAIASAGDGSVRFYRGEDLMPAGALALGSDGDNIRVDPRTGKFVVGYGEGGLAIIDPDKRAKIGDISLPAHPEGFAIDPGAGRAYVNLPDARQIAVDLVDRL